MAAGRLPLAANLALSTAGGWLGGKAGKLADKATGFKPAHPEMTVDTSEFTARPTQRAVRMVEPYVTDYAAKAGLVHAAKPYANELANKAGLK
jgi:hypothetical protein